MTVFSKAAELLSTLYGDLSAVITAAAVLCIAICAIKWVVASDPASVKSARTWLFSIITGLAVFHLARLIVDTVSHLAE